MVNKTNKVFIFEKDYHVDKDGWYDVKITKSSVITEIEYNKESKFLLLTFKSGNEYIYQDVLEKEFDELVRAGSIGSYFYHNIRNHHRWFRVSA